MYFSCTTNYFHPLRNTEPFLLQPQHWVLQGSCFCWRPSLSNPFPKRPALEYFMWMVPVWQKRKGFHCNVTLPAAWTTRPSVVVILELLGLAVSGSEVKIRKSAMKQRETETIRTFTCGWKKSLKALKVEHYYFPHYCLFSSASNTWKFPLSWRGGQVETLHLTQASLNRQDVTPNSLTPLNASPLQGKCSVASDHLSRPISLSLPTPTPPPPQPPATLSVF